MTKNLAVRDFLRNGGRREDLEERFAIKSVRHQEFHGLWLFKYNQIDSPFSEQIVRECRGLILDEGDDWKPICWPFQKFFNEAEGHADPIDWSCAHVHEKLDGSCMCLFWYRDRWNVSSSGSPDASGNVGNIEGMTFADLFWRVHQSEGWSLPSPQCKNLTLIFEMTTPYNRVVIPHQEEHLTLIGIRDRETGQEYPSWYAPTLEDLGLPAYRRLRSFDLSSFEDIHATFNEMSPLQQEGYVVVDKDFHRVKTKHPGYVAIHHMKDGLGDRRILEIIRSGEAPEFEASFLTHFPEYAPRFLELKEGYNILALQLEKDFARLRDIPLQKDFAIKAMACRVPGALFELRNGKAKTIKEHLAKIQVDKLLDVLSRLGIGLVA